MKIIIAGAGLVGQPVTITGLPGTPLAGQSKSVLAWGTPPAAGTSLTALGGRIAVFDQAITGPSAGKVVARADGKTTLVLRDVTSAQAIGAMIDGVPGQIEVSQIGQTDGFASGEHYWLAQDSTGRFAPTPGRRHRKIYVSGSTAAMSVAMIAAHAGVPASAVTGAWLVARPVYGGSESMAVTHDVFMLLADALWGRGKEGRSDWVRFERGYTYPLIRTTLGNGNSYSGESEIHPLVFEDWGSGPWPVIQAIAWTFSGGYGPKHTIFRNLRSPNAKLQTPSHVIFEGGWYDGGDYLQFDDGDSITLKDLRIVDHHAAAPKDGVTWNGSRDRISGSYASNVRRLAGIGLLVDMNGWAEGYDYNMSGQSPQPPSDRNHGLYWSSNCRHLTLRDNIVSRNASCGFQIRCGGYFERNLFLYNNLAFGGDADAYTNFTTLLDSAAFGSGHKTVASYQGALSFGYDLGSKKAVAIGNVIAHDADPANPAERSARMNRGPAYKGQPNTASTVSDWLYNDTQVHNWNGQPSERVDGIAPSVLNDTTIQKYAAAKLGKPAATLADLMAHARREGVSVTDLTRDIIAWTKARFGSPLPAVRTAPAMLIFLPDWRTEGFRWDNRRNWSLFDLPGTHVADSVDLDGNFVRFGTLTASIAALTSKGGILDVTSGKLTVGAITDAAAIRVRESGQIVIPATTQPLDIAADSGLTQIAGVVADLDLEVRGHAEVLLGPDCTVPAGKSLVISGQRPLVGWDGTGNAILTVAGTLEFRAGMMLTVSSAGSKQAYAVTGNDVVGTDFRATLADYEEQAAGTNHRLWLCDVTGLPVVGEPSVLGFSQPAETRVDEKVTVVAIASRGVAPLQRFRSGAVDDGLTEPTVNATVVLRAGARIVTTGFGPGTYDLGGGAGTGVTYVDQGATLPAGVSLTAGKLVLTV